MDINGVAEAFPELKGLASLDGSSGQKHVFFGTQDGTRVVLKLIRNYRGADERTEREIRAAEMLRCDFVPTIYSHGHRNVGGASVAFILEQHVPGETLRARLTAQPVQSLDFVLHLVDSLLSACHDFEQVHLVHRDIKPENLIIAPDGKVWVIDFGIARHLDLVSLTKSGGFGLGTWGYAAPEQFRNLKSDIDCRADLFSVGIVAYEALCGRHPYADYADNPLVLLRRMEAEDAPPLSVPAGDESHLYHFVMQLVQRYPSRRPQNASEARDWLNPIRDTTGNL